MAHATTCMTGGLRTMMHNDLAEEIADRMKDAGCRDVMLEPDLLSTARLSSSRRRTSKMMPGVTSGPRVSGGKNDARFSMSWFLRHLREVTQPEALRPSTLSMKVEKIGSTRSVFLNLSGRTSRLVFSLTVGMGPQAQAVIRRLGGLLAEREKVSKSDIMGWLRARLSFTVLRAVITCLRECRSLNYKACIGEVELAMSEARLC